MPLTLRDNPKFPFHFSKQYFEYLIVSIKQWSGKLPKKDKNEIVISKQTMKGLELESVQVLQVVVSSSTSSQISLFRYSSAYKIFSPLWKNNYTSNCC